eukprot:TRINITY_DN5749_c0_g2_i1.p1 TRINITY_DN5749_c0_g2~~TRINITY_DN5749_c0_g2_i1.p1  ORF type:complete len:273 (-),score=67.71 TRINITY_DN5749_c0_g2_i1:38-856(-)
MQRGLVGSEMCIRDRYQRRVHGDIGMGCGATVEQSSTDAKNPTTSQKGDGAVPPAEEQPMEPKNLGKIQHTPTVPKKQPDTSEIPKLDEPTLKEVYSESKAPEKPSLLRQIVEFHSLARGFPDFVRGWIKEKLSKEEETTPLAKQLKEARDFMKEMKPLPPLKYSARLSLVTEVHAKDLGTFGMVEHSGSDGCMLPDRLKKKGTYEGEIGESLLKTKSTTEEILTAMILDNTATKELRKNLFNPAFTQMGISIVNHEKLQNIIVINYAQSFN